MILLKPLIEVVRDEIPAEGKRVLVAPNALAFQHHSPAELAHFDQLRRRFARAGSPSSLVLRVDGTSSGTVTCR
jgi:hypothetical protein